MNIGKASAVCNVFLSLSNSLTNRRYLFIYLESLLNLPKTNKLPCHKLKIWCLHALQTSLCSYQAKTSFLINHLQLWDQMAQLKTLNVFVLSDLGLVSIISLSNSSNLWVTTISQCQYNADKTEDRKKDMWALGLSAGGSFAFSIAGSLFPGQPTIHKGCRAMQVLAK